MKFVTILAAIFATIITTTPTIAQEMRSIQMPDGSTMMFPVEPGSPVVQAQPRPLQPQQPHVMAGVTPQRPPAGPNRFMGQPADCSSWTGHYGCHLDKQDRQVVPIVAPDGKSYTVPAYMDKQGNLHIATKWWR